MKPKPFSFALALCAPLVLLSACGDDARSPTDPGPETVQQLEITTTILRFEAIYDCDGVSGAGDFRFTVTASGQKKTWERTVSSGSSVSLNWTTTRTINYAGTPAAAGVALRCSEMDQDILGNEYYDEDMTLRYLKATETVPGPDITNYMTLGNDRCKVRLHYKITSKIIEVEL